MKAVVYKGPMEVAVEEVADAKIERPTDVVVKITTTNICGSDLHMYEGRTDLEPGRVIGHENMGEVVEVGGGVERIRVGDHADLAMIDGAGRLVHLLANGQPLIAHGALSARGCFEGGNATVS